MMTVNLESYGFDSSSNKVYNYLLSNIGRASAKNICETLNMPSKGVYAALRQLEKYSLIETFEDEILPDDSFILNDPYLGGTHLPDITIVSAISYKEKIVGYSVSRAHHNDIGGMTPGSMPGNATEIFQEGLRIPPVKLVSKGQVNKDILNIIMMNSRTPKLRKGDLMAQLSANWTGEKRLRELIEQKGYSVFNSSIEEILNYSERRLLAILKNFPKAEATAQDFMDNDGIDDNPVKIQVKIETAPTKVVFDFEGTSPQVKGAINCPYAVTYLDHIMY